MRRIVPVDAMPRGESDPHADDRITFAVLKEIASRGEPAGCRRVRDALLAEGLAASETTAGRVLDQFDRCGWTVQAGVKRGRVLTELGQRRLAEIEDSRRRTSHDSDLLEALRADRVEDVVELMRVRIPVEVEAARLAALRASQAELSQLELVAEAFIEDVRQGKSPSEHNLAFHRLLSRASRSRIIQAVVVTLLEDEQLYEILRQIQATAGGSAPQEHLAIARAVASRQPDAAADAMRAHLDRIRKAVEKSGLPEQLTERAYPLPK